jgi:hypothetical protein
VNLGAGEPQGAPPRQGENADALQSGWLLGPFDVTVLSLGSSFKGHDVAAVFEAVRNSPSLKEKSEFETTPESESRQAGFSARPLFASVTPTGNVAFVVESTALAPLSKYDADSRVLTVVLSGATKRFVLEKEDTTLLDSVTVRVIVRDRNSYIGTNAFGANVKVDRTYKEELGGVFAQGNWLFGPPGDPAREMRYLLEMAPDEAKVLKPDIKLLLVCHLAAPWFHHSAHGHDPTIDEPYETLIAEHYLQILPEQLWVFNSRTGDVIKKLTARSVVSEQGEQLSLKLRESPLLLEVRSVSGSHSYRAKVDDSAETTEPLMEGRVATFRAHRRILFTVNSPLNHSDLSLSLNGVPYTPNWTKSDVMTVGGEEIVHSWTVTVTAP